MMDYELEEEFNTTTTEQIFHNNVREQIVSDPYFNLSNFN